MQPERYSSLHFTKLQLTASAKIFGLIDHTDSVEITNLLNSSEIRNLLPTPRLPLLTRSPTSENEVCQLVMCRWTAVFLLVDKLHYFAFRGLDIVVKRISEESKVTISENFLESNIFTEFVQSKDSSVKNFIHYTKLNISRMKWTYTCK